MAEACSGGEAMAMDAAIWGSLRDYIDLQSLVFAKLPLHAFFRLRLVCKEWNRLAADPAFLLQSCSPLPRPYFVVDALAARHRLLYRGGTGGAWAWTRLPPVKCEARGLLIEDSDSNRVFDVHTRLVRALPDAAWGRASPLPPEEELDYEEPVVGMVVDTSVKPFEFQVVLGDEVIRTRVYDSRSGEWTQKESTHDAATLRSGALTRPACASCGGVLYIRVFRDFWNDTLDLHCYDLRSDEWDFELLPGATEEDEEAWLFCDIGAWEDRLYMVGMKFQLPRRIVVWELWKQPQGVRFVVDEVFDGTWRVLDIMPEDLCSWMLAGKEEKLKFRFAHEFVDIKSRFCGEYVLVYNSGGRENLSEERAVLYNLESRKWEKVELPSSAV